MRRPSIIVFDLDGTLIEFRLELFEAKQRIIEMLTNSGVPSSMISPKDSIQALLQKTEQIFGHAQGGELRNKALNIMKEYEMRVATESRLRKGVSELLRNLKAHGFRLAVATNTHREAALLSLTRASILSFFEALVTRDDVSNLKPRGDLLRKLLEILRTEPGNVLYIGDSIHDLQASMEVGIAFIGVEGGVHNRTDLESAGCNHIISEPVELLRYLGIPHI